MILHEVFGTSTYKDEGVFIAGGAGVTPFISIFKQLEKLNQIGNNKLILANKSKADIILEAYFSKILGGNFINILSDEIIPNYSHTVEFQGNFCLNILMVKNKCSIYVVPNL